METVKDNLRK
jgi:hypothetical protein